jgi:hypothetical protein
MVQHSALLVVIVIAFIRPISILFLRTQECEYTSTVIVDVERNNGIVRRLSGAGPKHDQ